MSLRPNPKSIAAKAVFARCSVFIDGFTDEMSGHCLLLADRRNKELHSGEASFESVDTSTWLPQTYEVFETLLKSLGTSLEDFFGGEHAAVAIGMLKDRREHILKEVKERITAAKREFEKLEGTEKADRIQKAQLALKAWTPGALRKTCNCPACGFSAAISGEALNWGPIKVNEEEGTLSREVRALPNAFRCPTCGLKLDGYQELLQAGLGKPFVTPEEEDPIKFFGIIPEDHIDIDKVVQDYFDQGYNNE